MSPEVHTARAQYHVPFCGQTLLCHLPSARGCLLPNNKDKFFPSMKPAKNCYSLLCFTRCLAININTRTDQLLSKRYPNIVDISSVKTAVSYYVLHVTIVDGAMNFSVPSRHEKKRLCWIKKIIISTMSSKTSHLRRQSAHKIIYMVHKHWLHMPSVSILRTTKKFYSAKLRNKKQTKPFDFKKHI